MSTTQSQFDNIRENCKYYEPRRVKDLDCFEESISINHINARSMVRKLDDIKYLLSLLEHKITYICTSESWLNPTIEEGFDIEDELPQSRTRARVNFRF